MPSEFELIARHFTRAAPSAVLGVGDDAAIVRPSPGMELVISTDMLVADRHFQADADPEDLGWKVLAVNVSDLAAMGARPRWAVLAAALPAADERWIGAFAKGFFACAESFGVDLIGGDTTRGPRNFCAAVFGEVPPGQALLRSGARPGDDIWISGAPGRAALGLAHLQGRCALAEPARAACLAALHRPQPRVGLGLALRGVAGAAIDVSDGLVADLGHILERSAVSARLPLEALPAAPQDVDAGLWRDCLLAGGDDYELLFTAPAARRDGIGAIAAGLGLALTRIGAIVAGADPVPQFHDAAGQPVGLARRGYDHFR